MTRDRAEIARENGRKSKGARTAHGKAIVSQNAFKHGLTAVQPPVLLCEDSEVFGQIVAGLTDEYQPETATEKFFLMQAAMGMFKQSRLWRVEAADANAELIKLQIKKEFPETDRLCKHLDDSPIPGLTFERTAIARIIKHFEEFSETSDFDEFRELLSDDLQALQEDAPDCPVIHRVAVVNALIWRDSITSAQDAIAPVHRALHAGWLQRRIDDIGHAIERYNELQGQLSDAKESILSLQKPDLYCRYQSEIDRHIGGALDRLRAAQERNQ